mmetsp:Transcript_20910/g.57419  ORF Transcript_20910/g.57419 Transcript_20910/m.57419 type:complete len:109 (+) Transcript_20910:545-871(+)
MRNRQGTTFPVPVASPPPPSPPLLPPARPVFSPPPPPPKRCLDVFGSLTSARHLDPPRWCESFGDDRQACTSHYVMVDETRTRHVCLWDEEEADGGDACYRSEPIACV